MCYLIVAIMSFDIYIYIIHPVAMLRILELLQIVEEKGKISYIKKKYFHVEFLPRVQVINATNDYSLFVIWIPVSCTSGLALIFMWALHSFNFSHFCRGSQGLIMRSHVIILYPSTGEFLAGL